MASDSIIAENHIDRLLWLVIGIDVLTVVTAFLWLPRLVDNFSVISGLNAIWLIAAYGLFAVGVNMLRRLRPSSAGRSEWLSRRARVVLALLFALWLTVAIAWQLGWFESFYIINSLALGEGASSAYYVYAPSAWLALSMIYVLVLSFPVTERTVYGTTRYWIASAAGLAATAVMLLISAAQMGVMLTGLSPLLAAVISTLTLLMLFLPVRGLYLAKTTGLQSATARATAVFFVGVVILSAALAVAG